jgi:hypothetical protein
MLFPTFSDHFNQSASTPPAATRRGRVTLGPEFADSSLEESGFEPLVPPQSQHNNRGTGPMSPRRRERKMQRFK